jgi:N6-L-threonylcarbamoyladenine synthase
MQAHALTPRMVSALETPNASTIEPRFPFLSVLASGGHTLLIHSTSLVEHRVLGTTNDIAVGEFLDKVARIVLPAELLKQSKSTMYGALLETFVFPEAPAEKNAGGGSRPPSGASAFPAVEYLETFGHRFDWYQVPSNHEEASRKNTTSWGWAFNQPLTKANGGIKVNSIELSFTGLLTAVQRVVRYRTDPISKKSSKAERASEDISVDERVDIAREAMRAAFEHVAYRVVLAMKFTNDASGPIPAVVMAGGVAANSFLRHMWVVTVVIVYQTLTALDLLLPYALAAIAIPSCTSHRHYIAQTTQP